MAEITITIPDDLAQQLAPYEHQFSDLFTRLIAAPLLSQAISNSAAANPIVPHSTYQEILDFLVSQPTPAQIAVFKVSDTSQKRLKALLQKNREAALTDAETAELDLYEQLDMLMGLLKARACTNINGAPQN